ncbi:MAG TPA: tetratricopeptide repeat protein [Methylomirabilota bacterium]|jgi:tetratricopeptide (TPR) repeat protein|nr:tetratricopeptide repeat protein [Methylomirabilota bacterium]
MLSVGLVIPASRQPRPGHAARALLIALVGGVALASGAGDAQAATRPRAVLILPFQNVTPGGADGWLGEGIAETLQQAAETTPALLPIDRIRVAQAARAAGLDSQSGPPDRAGTATLARALRAELVFYGEYQRTADGGISIVPKLLDTAKGGEGHALDAVVASPDRILEGQAEIILTYAKALKLGLKPDEAQRLVAAAKPTTNLTAFEAYAKGRRSFLRSGQEGYEGAAELFARAIEIDPTFALAHYDLGLAHLALGNRWKGAAQFRAATQVDPTMPEPFKALGDLFMLSPRRLYDQAIEAYQKALSLRPHYAEAYVGLGDAKAAKGDHEGAIGHYQKALALDPLNARVHFSLGKIYYNEKGLYYEAVNAYKKAIELDQYFLDARMGLGEIYEEKGLYRDAIAEYKKVIEAEPKHTGAHYNLALAYEKVDVKEAITHWERYIGLASQIATEKEWVDVARQHLKKLRDKEKSQ